MEAGDVPSNAHTVLNSPPHYIVTFRLWELVYALPIEPIVRLIAMAAITPLPQESQAVEGVLNVRGQIAPIVNLRRHLNMPPVPFGLHTPIILVRLEGLMLGLIVDEVLDVLALTPDRLIAPAAILPPALGAAPLLQGVARLGAEPVLVLALEQLFSSEQVRALNQAAAALREEDEARADAPAEGR